MACVRIHKLTATAGGSALFPLNFRTGSYSDGSVRRLHRVLAFHALPQSSPTVRGRKSTDGSFFRSPDLRTDSGDGPAGSEMLGSWVGIVWHGLPTRFRRSARSSRFRMAFDTHDSANLRLVQHERDCFAPRYVTKIPSSINIGNIYIASNRRFG